MSSVICFSGSVTKTLISNNFLTFSDFKTLARAYLLCIVNTLKRLRAEHARSQILWSLLQSIFGGVLDCIRVGVLFFFFSPIFLMQIYFEVLKMHYYISMLQLGFIPKEQIKKNICAIIQNTNAVF